MNDGELSIDRVHESRKVLTAARAAIACCHGDTERYQEAVDAALNDVERLLTAAPDAVPRAWSLLRAGLVVLAAAGKCLAIAKSGRDVTAEHTRLGILHRELKATLQASAVLPPTLASAREQLCAAAEADARNVAAFLLALPVPLIYWEKRQDADFGLARGRSQPAPSSPFLRIIAFLDGAPLVTPQLLSSGVVYTLRFRVRGTGWPTGALSLHLALVSTLPHDEYSLSPFVLGRPVAMQGDAFEGELTGNVKFHSPQSSLLDDIVFGLRAAFALPDSVFDDVPIIGHHELRVRVVSPEHHPLMGGNRHLDRHIVELVLGLVKALPSVQGELPDLLRMLEALNRLLAAYAQEAIYKGRATVPEKEFQAMVLRDLRFQLGQEVQEHPRQAGGITDIRYRGVIVELKVESENGDRVTICEKYTAQAAQYAGVEARQVAVVLVLDLTPKDRPPGDIRNDVLLVDVPTHGGADAGKPHPSRAFVFVVNGNMKSPSDYS